MSNPRRAGTDTLIGIGLGAVADRCGTIGDIITAGGHRWARSPSRQIKRYLWRDGAGIGTGAGSNRAALLIDRCSGAARPAPPIGKPKRPPWSGAAVWRSDQGSLCRERLFLLGVPGHRSRAAKRPTAGGSISRQTRPVCRASRA